MKTIKILSPVLALFMLTGVAHANETDAQASSDSTVKTRTVHYTCQTGGKVRVKYGFNRQNLPTYAQATLSGKSRFMPINLAHSSIAGTMFGDENNWSLSTDYMEGRKLPRDILITDPASQITHKGCRISRR